MDTVKKQEAPRLIRAMNDLFTYVINDFLGGPKVLKFAWVINFQKASTFFFVALLMMIYENYSTAAWVYMALHGSYGFCWLLKHFAFPDSSWEKKITFGGAVMSFLFVLGPYWLFPYLLISSVLGTDHPAPSNPMLMFCISLHTLGVVIMMASDCQKYYMLKYRQGLIENGMFKYIRRPNYLGEIMLYASYALMVGHWIPWAILALIWSTIFLTNMLMIESSLSRYSNWKAYKGRTAMLFPLNLLTQPGSLKGDNGV
jgi:protein-S-isoprenylcysteine O-methyltransferase Ste14